jgi:hypothetical protein
MGGDPSIPSASGRRGYLRGGGGGARGEDGDEEDELYARYMLWDEDDGPPETPSTTGSVNA